MAAPEPVLIVDGHLDLAFNALHHRRDLTQCVQTLREREDVYRDGVGARSIHPDALRKTPRSGGMGIATVALPELRAGHVGIVLATIMARVQMPTSFLSDGMRTQAAAHAIGQSHLHYYKALERAGEIDFLRTAHDLENAIGAWSPTSAKASADPAPSVGIVLSMESADPILGPDDVQAWYDAGLRSVSLTHFGSNTWGHGTGTKGGLYPCAYPLLDALRAAGVALDVSHAADLAFWQLLDYWDGPIHASHCMCRALVPGQRHLSDDMIKAVAERGGVIGMVMAEPMLNPDINFDDLSTAPAVSTRPMAAVADHIEHICALTGSNSHVAIGSDLDGGFGREWAPVDCDTVADLQKLPDLLERRGLGGADVAAITHGNLLSFLRRVLV
ncbi:MAG TPA: membrane dipeptidase [Candidatus Latescibacteria bacterium]|nr:membrane dipeptidase [Candidatus Latescibacterota bacterium]HJP30177.1 membrane dipeptidase [Candidatus Latescibacterota bacterium]